ncbi:unnamed protein product [Ectocarpus sp. 12 AP-2014]
MFEVRMEVDERCADKMRTTAVDRGIACYAFKHKACMSHTQNGQECELQVLYNVYAYMVQQYKVLSYWCRYAMACCCCYRKSENVTIMFVRCAKNFYLFKN